MLGSAMASGHADGHDLDKLARWHESLPACDGPRFPIHALFLVSAEDKAAHDAFRQFRARFESLGAGFHHLVILGQHAVSGTVLALLPGLGLEAASIPVLVLYQGRHAPSVYLLPLPGRNDADSGQSWRGVLSGVEEAVAEGKDTLLMDTLPGIRTHHLGGPTVDDLVREVLGSLARPALAAPMDPGRGSEVASRPL